MQDNNYSRCWRHRATRALAVVFLLIGLYRTATLAWPLIDPEHMAILIDFGPPPTIEPYGIDLLTPEQRVVVERSPATVARYHARLADPAVRARLFGYELTARLPQLLLLWGLGIALWRLARPGADAARRAMPWLVRATMGGVIYAAVSPVIETLRNQMLLTTVVADADNGFLIDLEPITYGLLFAGAAWAATWAIAEGVRARAELDAIV